MYRIRLILENPMTGSSDASLTFQFDPTSLTQAKWNAAFPTVADKLAALIQSSTPEEPAKW